MISHYPRLIEDDVYFCGCASPKSYGAASYFIRRPEGNWLTDAPRWDDGLAERLRELGGLAGIFLTHRDDVADADLYAERFGALRVIHEADRSAAPRAELVLTGDSPAALGTGLTAIPVPGHTKGHAVLLYKDTFLFTGDHLEGDAANGALGAFRDFCCYDWGEQTRSMERLLAYRFEWVLPGHGGRLKLPPERMRSELAALVARMREA